MTEEINNYGEPGEELVQQARALATNIFERNTIGLPIDSLAEIDWYDKLYYVHDDEELLERVTDTLREAIYEHGFSANDRKLMLAVLE